MTPKDLDQLEKLHGKLNRKLAIWEKKKLSDLIKSFREAEIEIKALLVTAEGWEKTRFESLLTEIDRIMDKMGHSAELWVTGRSDVPPESPLSSLSQYPALTGGSTAIASLGVTGTFTMIHLPVLSYLQDYQLGLIRRITQEVRDQIKEELKRGYIQGEGIPEIAKRLRDTKLDKGVWPTLEKRAEVIARTEILRASNQGALFIYNQYQVKRVMWIAADDERTCDICGTPDGLHGRIFPINNIPFGGPPAHPRCYDKETEVYTDKGWLKFSELKGNEMFLSLNQETHQPEWVSSVHSISYHFNGDMVRLKSNSLDMMVTPNHQMYVGRRKGTKRQVSWGFVDAGKLEDISEFYINKTCNWAGEKIDYIDINGLVIPIEIFSKFMGYYLSEGSTIKKSDNCYQISISQEKPDSYNKIYQDIKDLPVKVDKGKGKFYIFSVELGKYLEQLGQQHIRYVPDEIKKLPREILRLFIDAYVLGDGSVKECKWEGKRLKSISRKIDTCSPRMAADLGEVILKAGFYPSFSLRKTKGKQQVFKNGIYTINHNTWVIFINNKKHSIYQRGRETGVKLLSEQYDDIVYCVELEKNHILWVRRNGKAAWCGNCRCFITPHIVTTEEEGQSGNQTAKKNVKWWKEKQAKK